MIDRLRVIFATVLFCISSYLVYDLFANGFSWVTLLISICGYLLIHYIWPKRTSQDSDWIDLLELVVDLPYRSIALALRSIGSLLRNGDVGIGL
jgi:hypothetical protein